MRVKATKTEKVEVEVSAEDLLNALGEHYLRATGINPNSLMIKGDIKYVYECTSLHNNDWEYVPERLATAKELEVYKLWKEIKKVINEPN